MADLKALQDELNSSEKMRAEFFKDPVGYLNQRGVTLPKEAAAALKASASQAKTLKKPVAGSSVGPAAGGAEISINIGVKF